jgi:hypothetical protein
MLIKKQQQQLTSEGAVCTFFARTCTDISARHIVDPFQAPGDTNGVTNSSDSVSIEFLPVPNLTVSADNSLPPSYASLGTVPAVPVLPQFLKPQDSILNTAEAVDHPATSEVEVRGSFL